MPPAPSACPVCHPVIRRSSSTHVGRSEQFIDVTVNPLAISRVDVKMKVVSFAESVTVTAEALILDSQERALNQQKTAPNITNVVSADQIGSFPDRNAAETTQRIPGVSITKDQGEGRYVNVRGTEPRLNSMMIDGAAHSVARSADSPGRARRRSVGAAAVDRSVEGADAGHGRRLDRRQRQSGDEAGAGEVPAVRRRSAAATTSCSRSYEQNNYSADGRPPVQTAARSASIASVSGSETNRGNQDMEVVYTPTLGAERARTRAATRSTAAASASPARSTSSRSDNASTRCARVFNRFIDDHENRQRVRYAVANRRIDRELRDRTHIERITSLSFSGQHIVRRVDDGRLPAARRLLRSVRSADDDDDVPADAT